MKVGVTVLSNLPVIGQMFKHFTDGGLNRMTNHCTGTSEVIDGKEIYMYKANLNPLDPVPEWITIDFSNAVEEGIRIDVVGRK